MTDNGGWRSEAEERQCPKCREERLVLATTIYGKKSYYCQVCSHGWTPSAAVCVINGEAMYDP